MKISINYRADYVERVLKLYLGLALTPTRVSRLDRQLAENFYDEMIKLEQIEAAMILVSVRRLLRAPGAPNLGQIRSLHYFVPVIEEVQDLEITPDYIAYLRRRLDKVKWLK